MPAANFRKLPRDSRVSLLAMMRF